MEKGQGSLMKVLWIIPISITNNLFMVAIKNCFAKAFKGAGLEIETIAAYDNNDSGLEDFSRVVYFQYKRPRILYKILFHLKIAKEILLTDFDVLLIGYSAGHFIPLSILVRQFKKKTFQVVLDIRTVPVDLKNDLGSLINQFRYAAAVRLAAVFCDGVTCITSFLADRLEQQFKRLKGKTHVLSTAADFGQFDPRKSVSLRNQLCIDNRFVLLYHGVLSPNRGIQNVLKAVARCVNAMPDLLFMIVGAGPAEDELKTLSVKYEVKEHVLFTGNVPHSAIPDYIASSDLGIIPMPDIDWWNLNSPIKLKEYLAMGLPVLATDIQSHRQVVERCGGAVLMDDHSPESIQTALLAYRENSRLDFELQNRQALEKAISFDAEAGKLANFFRSLLSN
jgi:glycosyltransferase involved in cell wall biosynthesis